MILRTSCVRYNFPQSTTARSLVVCATRDDRFNKARVGMTMLERAAKILETVQTFFDHVDARSVTEPDGAVVTEGGSGNDGDVRFAQQTIGEILGSQSELTDIYQHIKRPLWLDRGHIRDLGNAIEHIITTHIEFLAHISQRLLIALQGSEPAIL